MRQSAVNDCIRKLQESGIDASRGEAIDIGGTREVNLDGQIQTNPLCQLSPNLTFLDKGFNIDKLGTTADEEVDFLDPSLVSHLKERFDVVYSFDTLEHISDPFLFCDHLLQIVKSGGYVYLATVFSWPYHPSPEDYYRFSPSGLRELFKKHSEGTDAKCEVMWCDWGSDPNGVAMLVRRLPVEVSNSGGTFDYVPDTKPAAKPAAKAKAKTNAKAKSDLTIFAMPKHFRDHAGIIQRNAILSWTMMEPRPEIILFGDEEGTAEIAQELGLVYEPNAPRSEYGTPLVNGLFERAEQLASNKVVAYVNSDIILMDDFAAAIKASSAEFDKFLMIGQRWDLDVKEPLDFTQGWQERLLEQNQRQGSLHPSCGIDYFVYTKGLYSEIPPFAIGRFVWDNWLVYTPLSEGVPVVDATASVTIVHQNHDYSHVKGGLKEAENGIEAKRNYSYGGHAQDHGHANHASWELTPAGLTKRHGSEVEPAPAVVEVPDNTNLKAPEATGEWLQEMTMRINRAAGDPAQLIDIAGQLTERGHDDTGEQLARMVIGSNPSYAEAYNLLGVIYHARDCATDALRYFENARRLDQFNADIGKNLVGVHVQLGNYEQAIEVCQDMLKINPNDTELMQIIGTLLETIGESGLDSIVMSQPPDADLAPVSAPNAVSNEKYKPNLKYSFGMIVLNGDDFIECALKSVYDFAHEIIIVEGAVEEAVFMVGPDGGSRDKTVQLIESFPDPDNKITLIRGRWTDKTQQSNVYMQVATGDYVWQLDSDEVWRWEDLMKIDQVLTQNKDRVDMVSFTPVNFYHNLWTIGKGGRWEERSDPFRRIFKREPGCHFSTHWPPTVEYPDVNKDRGHLEAEVMEKELGIYLYHFSYVTKKQVEEKVEYYNRKGYGPIVGNDLGTWYERVWSRWTHPGCEVEKLNGSHVNTRQPTWTEYFTGELPEVMKSHPLYGQGRPAVIQDNDTASQAGIEFWNLPSAAETGCFAQPFQRLLMKNGYTRPSNGKVTILNFGGRKDDLRLYAGNDLSWLGTDIAYKTIDINPGNNPDICADIHDLSSIPAESADIIICTEVIMYSSDPERAFAEMSRVLKPGGFVFFTTPMLYPRDEPANPLYSDCTRVLAKNLLESGSVKKQLKRFVEMYGLTAQKDIEKLMSLNGNNQPTYRVYDITQITRPFTEVHAYPAFDSPKEGSIKLVVAARK